METIANISSSTVDAINIVMITISQKTDSFKHTLKTNAMLYTPIRKVVVKA